MLAATSARQAVNHAACVLRAAFTAKERTSNARREERPENTVAGHRTVAAFAGVEAAAAPPAGGAAPVAAAGSGCDCPGICPARKR